MHYAIQWYKSNNAGFVKNIDYGKGMSQIRHVCPNIGIHFWPISMKFCMNIGTKGSTIIHAFCVNNKVWRIF